MDEKLKDAISRAVDKWVADRIQNSPVARSVAAWNHLVAAVPELKEGLAAAVEAELPKA